MTEKLKMKTADMASENFEKLKALFPNCVTELLDKDGNPVRAIDKDLLMQEINSEVVEGQKERYQFNWPGKRDAIRKANAPTTMTLRPCKGESVDFDNTQNLYIEGDNLEVLKLLQNNYLGKVKMIYIDPPYNTGNDFVYNDDFKQDSETFLETSGMFDEDGNMTLQNFEKNSESNGRFHTDWLNMMYPRLKVARNLLSDDGVIFISIDDHEQANLSKICDEIWGRENFIGLLSVENNPKGRKNSKFVSVSSEYCLIYAKKIGASYFCENIPKKASDMSIDENGNFVHNSGKRVLVGENDFNKVVSNFNSEKNYSVYYLKSQNDIVIKKEKIDEKDEKLLLKGYVKYSSVCNNKLIENTYTETKFLELFAQKALDFGPNKIYEKNFSDTIRIKSQLVNREYEAIIHGKKQKYSMELTTTGAGTYLKDLFNTKEPLFPASKNIGFLKLLISLIDDKNFIALDFFSGSASFADSIMHINCEDCGSRKFICVQLPELIEKGTEAYKTCYKNICEIGKERIRLAGKKIKEENGEKATNLDIGFRVLKLAKSNMNDVYYKPADIDQGFLDKLESNIKKDRTPMDLLFQVMLECDLELSSKIEEREINGKKVFFVNDKELVACFDEKIDEATITEIAKLKPYYFVMRDSSLATDNVADNFEQLWNAYSKDTIRKVL